MRTPVFLQNDEADCSCACLASVAKYYKHSISLAKCRQLIRVDSEGASMYGLVQGAIQIGFDAQAQKGTWQELQDKINQGILPIPFIAHTIQNDYAHFIVVYNITSSKIVVVDPAKGRVSLTINDFLEIWTGKIISLYPNKQFYKKKRIDSTLKYFARLLVKEKYSLICVMLISFIMTGISLLGATFFQIVVDNLVYRGTNSFVADSNVYGLSNNIGLLCVITIAFFTFQAAISILRSHILAKLSMREDVHLTTDFLHHLLHLPMDFFRARKSGEILSRFSEVSNLREAISGGILSAVINFSMVIFFGCYLFRISFRLFAILLCLVVFYTVIVIAFAPRIKQINTISMEQSAETTTQLTQIINGIETIKGFNDEDLFITKIKDILVKLTGTLKSGTVISASKDAIITLLESIGIVVLLWVGNHLCNSATISVGQLISFYVMMNSFLDPIQELIGLQAVFQTAMVSSSRLDDVLEFPVEETQASTISTLRGDIVFDNITFRYGYRDPVIKSLSAHIPHGTKVALVGASGAGKTTLMHLLMSFFTPATGNIYVDGKNLSEYDPRSVRKKIAYVSSNPTFFSESIWSNLRMGNQNLSAQEIIDTCVKTGADEFIKQLPHGYESVLNENGLNLSGGQRQKLGITRALLAQPDVIILDEATANLDAVSENTIKHILFDDDKKRTIIIIAHRLNTIKNCDMVWFMDNGNIVESGTHEELIQSNGLYAKYWEANI